MALLVSAGGDVRSVIEGSQVELVIFDVAGRRVRTLADGYAAGGSHSLTWRGRGDQGESLS